MGWTGERESLIREVRRLGHTRETLSERLHLVLTALALTADAEALSRQRLDAAGVNGVAPYVEAAELQRAADQYRRMLLLLPLTESSAEVVDLYIEVAASDRDGAPAR